MVKLTAFNQDFCKLSGGARHTMAIADLPPDGQSVLEWLQSTRGVLPG